jgi:hypothetical protein
MRAFSSATAARHAHNPSSVSQELARQAIDKARQTMQRDGVKAETVSSLLADLGGAEFVIYRATPADVESGVRVGDRVYPGFPATAVGIKSDPALHVAFFALATYVAVTSVAALVEGAAPAHSPLGIVVTALSVAIMPVLSLAERRAGREIGSASVVADSRQTLICTYLSAAVLLGLVTNSLFGWWWADAVAALVIAVFAVREGVDAWRGDACATSVGMLLEDETDHHH